jgi:predicted porin
MQLSGSYHNESDFNSNPIYELERKNGLGGNIVYALGPIYFGISYLQATLKDNVLQDTYRFQLISYGLMINIAGIYSSLALINENNKDFIGEDAFGFTYLLKYDYNNDNIGFVPQIIYGYKKDSNSNLIVDNYLYASLSYYFSSSISTFIDSKIDFRTNNQLYNLNQNKDNKITIGLKYDYY